VKFGNERRDVKSPKSADPLSWRPGWAQVVKPLKPDRTFIEEGVGPEERDRYGGEGGISVEFVCDDFVGHIITLTLVMIVMHISLNIKVK
jgi:hypothetical protein